MTSIPYTSNWVCEGRRHSCTTGGRKVVGAAALTEVSIQSNTCDMRLADQTGRSIGVVIAPRSDVMLNANGPTLYLERRRDR